MVKMGRPEGETMEMRRPEGETTDQASSLAILSLLGFPLGTLPIKFLGVPLISSKLSLHDCMPLINRMVSKVTSWTSKILAYSRRLQLINSVLFAIQSFWSRHFILPKAALSAIKSIMSRFLWKGPSLAKYGAKVAWRHLAMPKQEGGLGVKCIMDWNRSSIMLHLINIVKFNTNSLWANWVKSTILKGRNFWQASIPLDCSWIWKQILKLRPAALVHLKYHVGRGNNINLWYDPWINGTSINPNALLLSNSGLPNTATVSSILANSAWSLPSSFHHEVIQFRNRIAAIPAPTMLEDSICWDSMPLRSVKARHIWDSIRATQQEVNWHKILWHKLHVPRYSFILWLGLLKRLPTSDITVNYSHGQPHFCPLCMIQNESFEHLFFQCAYSTYVLQSSLTVGNWQHLPMHWSGLIDSSVNYHGCNLTKHILWLTIAATFYKIWEMRNKKLHGETLIPPRQLAKDIINIIKCRVSTSTTFVKTANTSTYFCNWLI